MSVIHARCENSTAKAPAATVTNSYKAEPRALEASTLGKPFPAVSMKHQRLNPRKSENPDSYNSWEKVRHLRTKARNGSSEVMCPDPDANSCGSRAEQLSAGFLAVPQQGAEACREPRERGSPPATRRRWTALHAGERSSRHCGPQEDVALTLAPLRAPCKHCHCPGAAAHLGSPAVGQRSTALPSFASTE